MNKPKMVPFNGEEHPDLREWDEFVEACLEGDLIDEDGFGELATETEVSSRTINPSRIVRGFRKPEWCTHVVWYNR